MLKAEELCVKFDDITRDWQNNNNNNNNNNKFISN